MNKRYEIDESEIYSNYKPKKNKPKKNKPKKTMNFLEVIGAVIVMSGMFLLVAIGLTIN